MILEFKKFLLETGTFETDLKESLKKLPLEHQRLVKDYKFIDHPENTIKGDKHSCGLIDEKKKTITIASPWNYPREYTLLHEIGHLVWKYLVSDEKKNSWKNVVKETKSKNNNNNSLKQNDEELFCMAYSATYCNQPVVAYNHKKWLNFIKNI